MTIQMTGWTAILSAVELIYVWRWCRTNKWRRTLKRLMAVPRGITTRRRIR